jgi:hypothetical protein
MDSVTMKSRMLFLVAFLIVFSANGGSDNSEIVLSSLYPECKLEVRWFGMVQVLPEAMWLTCRDSSFLVYHPWNMIGHVKIHTSDQALEFVRLFSKPNLRRFFDLQGMVEIIPWEKTDDLNFRLNRKDFLTHFREASAKEVVGSSSRKDLGFGKEYVLVRVVMFPDQTIYELTESVFENGFYGLVSKRLLFKDGKDIGLFYFLEN